MFGPTDPAINGPYNAAGAALVHADACSQRRPFVPGPLTACPDCRCVELITVERAWDATTEVLAGAGQRQSRSSEV
jgi:hypothetical protein